MKRTLLSALMMLFALCQSLSAQVTLCHVTSVDRMYGASNANYTAHTTFSPARLAPYVGAKITAIRVGIGTAAQGVTASIRHHATDRNALCSQSMGDLRAGWNEVTLDQPYTITADDSLTLSYSGTFPIGGGVGLSLSPTPDGCSLLYNNATKQWESISGSVCIQAVVEGDNLPTTDLAANMMADVIVPELQETAIFKPVVIGSGTDAVQSYTLRYGIEGSEMQEETFSTNLTAGQSDSCSLAIWVPSPGTYTVVAVITAVNGAPDACAKNDTVRALLRVHDEGFEQRVVCEEYTGTWCGYCPRGIVGIETVRAAHPDQFIVVSAHNRDDLTMSDEAPSYADFVARQTKGAPSCEINRCEQMDPNATTLSKAFDKYVAMKSNVGVKVEATLDKEQHTVHATAHIAKDKACDEATFQVALVVTESGITGYSQKNYYAGGSYGAMGGWENKGNPTYDVVFNDVARAVNNFYGKDVTFTQMQPAQYYPYSEDVDLSYAKIANHDSLQVIALVMQNGQILNAAICRPTPADVNGIISTEGHDAATAVTAATIYTLDGRCVGSTTMTSGRTELPSSLPAGMYILHSGHSTTKMVKQ